MTDDMARLAKALVEYREAEGIDTREMAYRTQLSHATIRFHESDRGRLPTFAVARRFEQILGWAPGTIPSLADNEADAESPAASGSDE
jgi:hypothetical protein